MINRAGPVTLLWAGLLTAFSTAGAAAQEVSTSREAVMRGLDRLSGELTEFELSVGRTVPYHDLRITLAQCRYPTDNPSGDAYGYFIIEDRRVETPVFEGWMIASSPALNALDHMRYDVWLMRCKTS